MTKDEAREFVVAYWMEKADAALQSARSELAAGRYDFAVNRAYYACFYCVSAVLLQQGRKFAKHAGVRSALHEHLVKTGLLDPTWGRFYDRIFSSRQRADYQELVRFAPAQVSEYIQQAEAFVHEMQRIVTQ